MNVCLIDEVAGGVSNVEIFDETSEWAGLLRRRHVHGVVGADDLFLRAVNFARRARLLLLLLLVKDWVLSISSRKARQLATG